jgi:hypothetical protein
MTMFSLPDPRLKPKGVLPSADVSKREEAADVSKREESAWYSLVRESNGRSFGLHESVACSLSSIPGTGENFKYR